MEDSLEIIEAYRVFLLTFFEPVARTHLCSQAVQNQVIALYGGRHCFTMCTSNVKSHPDKLFSAWHDKFQMCCHPEFLLNKRYQNKNT